MEKNPRLSSDFRLPKLWEFFNILATTTGTPVSMIVIDDNEETADKIASLYPDLDQLTDDDEILATIHSAYKLCVTMNDSFCDRRVMQVYTLGPNSILVNTCKSNTDD